MSDFATDKDMLIQELLQERDELFQELSRLRKVDNGALDTLEAKNQELTSVVAKKDQQIHKLTDQLAWFRHKFFGSSSEKHIAADPNQRKIDWEGLEVLPEEKEAIEDAEKELIEYERRKPNKEKKKPVRQPLPEHLRRVVEVIEPEGIQDNWVRIGEEVTEILEHKPGETYVRRIERIKYAIKPIVAEENAGNEQNEEEAPAIRIAPMPLLPLPRSNAGPSMLAELMMNKYFYHLPFHRQISMFKMIGVRLPASTVNGWFQGSSDLLRALYNRLKEKVLETDYIQVDESTIPVINNQKHKTTKAYLWMVRSVMDNLVFFHYDKGSRAQRVVVDLLKDYQGAVQTDGYEAYSIYEQKKGVLLLGCWAHARRKFSESLAEDKSGAEYALAQIAKFYQVEKMADEQELDHEQRAELRKRLAYPIMRAFEKWIEGYYPKTLAGGRMSRALTYTYNLFMRLSRYHLDGRYLPDNNLAENAIRPLAIGRKGYLFCGNHDAAENAAIMYSLLGCCKASDVNPREWLSDVFAKIPQYNRNYDLDLADLLPHNWKKSNDCQNFPESSN
ncbi:IS66 family transposase [Marinilabilia salmonicolor]|uniref:Transposase n=1 Tax=Marinilabilia salmonicolor TaxID=989 RepID=A0A368UK50_9BACT|nr:IS66 family transposase [Marinilabilia salmonicolor]RCW20257.1 transposase [Marinilabilia salmonicolor]